MTDDYIVDAHHHLWDLEVCKHTWLAEKGVIRFFGDPAPIQKNYHATDLIADIGTLPVRKSVHIQCGVAEEDAVAETMWIDSQARSHEMPNAIVAFCDLTDQQRDAALDQHAKSPRFRGVRQIVGRSTEEDRQTGTAALLENPEFLSGLKRLAERGLSFDLQLTPPLMRAAAEVFGGVPELNVALCHCGSPSDFTKNGTEEWQTGLRALAALPNLICKVSGFGMFNHDWTTEGIRPHVLSVIDIFGPERVAFGSNFPVDRLHASYGEVMVAHINIVSSFSVREQRQMLAGTAERFYRI
ncbi:MAG: amidohydrolase family protein [Pseudomonadota bacterium]